MSLPKYRDALVARLFGPNPNTPQIITGVALGAVAAVLLPELANITAWLRLHVFHGSKLWRYQHAPLTAPTDDSLNLQAWALVTGATDGIGYGFVCEFASRNVNVILHGRNAEKLNRIIKELKAKHPRLHFEPFVCDATDRASWHSKFDELIPRLRKRNINLTILVNNLGGNPTISKSCSTLQSYTPTEANALIDMNVTFPTQVTRALLPILIDNKPSLIVNVSSLAAHQPMPWLSMYSGSKAYGSQFTKALRTEMAAEGLADEEEGVEVFSAIGGKIQSAGMKVGASLSVPTSRDFAKSVLGKVGCGQDEVVSYWVHSIQLWMVGCMNDGLRNWFIKRELTQVRAELEREGKKAK